MDAQTNWENQRAIDCAEHNQPRCRSFPDCGCLECHASHLETGEFNPNCETCLEEKCDVCNGTGYIGTGKNEEECHNCDAQGRIKNG